MDHTRADNKYAHTSSTNQPHPLTAPKNKGDPDLCKDDSSGVGCQIAVSFRTRDAGWGKNLFTPRTGSSSSYRVGKTSW